MRNRFLERRNAEGQTPSTIQLQPSSDRKSLKLKKTHTFLPVLSHFHGIESREKLLLKYSILLEEFIDSLILYSLAMRSCV